MVRQRFGGAPQAGYTYVGLLIFIAVFGFMSANGLRWGVTMQRRVAEQELLERGLGLSLALESYARATPAGQSPFPRSVDDLLRDPRFLHKPVRHLRRVEVDPMTGSDQWDVVMAANGSGIVGFRSRSRDRTLRQELRAPFADFNDSTQYNEWIFKSGLGE